ncbi:class I SAM-dependent DNA methyltransferase [Halobacillus mangrovi]|uniref:class I SAM-dependent DNA methyltransferase n=1 Tax=Halobacillus mangrovi TaxID=402384 RepID=UPI003D9625F4
MSYHQMAQVYDRLMADAPYDDWVKFTKNMIKEFHPHVKAVLDAGCGTGEITHRLHGGEFVLTGVDLSEEMLAMAQQKNPRSGIQWLHQDMTQLEGINHYDCVISYCDVLNYLTDEISVRNAFTSIYDALNSKGLFLFDVHSIDHIHEDLYGSTFAEVYDELSYVWFCDPGETDNSVVHDLTFFLKDGDKYTRFDERHNQKGYPINDLQHWLEEAGFKIKRICADFDEKPSTVGDRLFFVCQKA